MDDIIKGWRDQLESHAQSFVSQAALLQRWDAAVLSNRQVLMSVEGELRGVHAKQEGLDRQLCQIETHQKEVHDALSSVEAEAERMFGAERRLMDADAQERDRLYARAQQVASKLAAVADDLSRSVDQVNRMAASSLGDPETPLGAVVRILNGQLQALSQLEARVDELASDVARASGGGRAA